MKIKLYATYEQYDWESEGRMEFWTRKMSESADCIQLREIEVEIPDIELPSRDQMARVKVAALQEEKKSILAECHQRVAKIDDKIQQLLSLPNLTEVV